jgi:RHS repeat-associated protein
MTTTSGSVYYHHDGLGSTVALTDAAGAKIESYTYDAFGTVSIFDAAGFLQSSSSVGNRFLFTGREWITELGLYDYCNRVYSAELGRFLQTDPIQFDAGDVNLYRYGQNNPVTTIDTAGEGWILVGAAVVATGYLIYKVYKYVKESNDFCKSAKEYKEVWEKIDEMSTEEFGNNFDDIQKELKDKVGKMIKDAGESAGAGGALPGTVGGGPGPRPLP